MAGRVLNYGALLVLQNNKDLGWEAGYGAKSMQKFGGLVATEIIVSNSDSWLQLMQCNTN
ncbi:hypothetical protein MTR_3g110188 [Medicago truncatula]|uniref:Uncharacterized protein n=1 Tax=Medicago truncatula TaxID=3880 RepID=A0A072V2H2_MEDTR|nr:hypothetical protein MTR_3g110188 [Medicago truncatula]